MCAHKTMDTPRPWCPYIHYSRTRASDKRNEEDIQRWVYEPPYEIFTMAQNISTNTGFNIKRLAELENILEHEHAAASTIDEVKAIRKSLQQEILDTLKEYLPNIDENTQPPTWGQARRDSLVDNAFGIIIGIIIGSIATWVFF